VFYGPLGVDLVGRTGAERLRRAGTPAARGGGRCDRPVPARAAREGLVNGRRSLLDAREGGEGLGSMHSRPGLELATVASNGAGGGSTAAWPGQEGRCPLYG
jgi:hypothetical protein